MLRAGYATSTDTGNGTGTGSGTRTGSGARFAFLSFVSFRSEAVNRTGQPAGQPSRRLPHSRAASSVSLTSLIMRLVKWVFAAASPTPTPALSLSISISHSFCIRLVCYLCKISSELFNLTFERMIEFSI